MRRGGGMLAVCAAGLAAVSLPVALAWAAGVIVPSRKPGQWELRMTAGDAPEAVLQMCVDEATDKEMMDASLSIVTAICPLPIWSRDGNAIIILADCQVSTGRTVISRAELSGDFQSEYIFKVNTKTGLGAASEIEHRYTWVGKTCSDGLLPGVVKLPNGGKMKLKQMMKLLENINGN
jgi:hypothetical protein